MKLSRVETDGGAIAVVSGSELLIKDVQSDWILWQPFAMKQY